MKFRFLVLVCLVVLAGCASTLPKQIPDALDSGCNAYTVAKPQVIQARTFLIQHWNDKIPGTDQDFISAENKAKLQDFDKNVLPKLDTAGMTICAAAGALHTLTTDSTQKFDVNQALDVVFKAASFALEMKAKGAF